MVNTLTRMIPDLFEPLDIVSREPVGSCRLSPSIHAPPVTRRSATRRSSPVGVACPSAGTEAQRGVVGWDGVSRMVPLDDDAIEQRWKEEAEHARIMALPKPKTPDDEIAELKQRIAALEAKQAAKP